MTDAHPRIDKENCPRGDGGRLRKVGSFSRDRYMPDVEEDHFECSVCGRWWTTIELRRLS